MPESNNKFYKIIFLRVSLLTLFFCFSLIVSASAFSSKIYSSSDGKIKLIVPSDALLTSIPKIGLQASLPAVNIKVKRMAQGNFSSAIFPKNTQFLIAADFKPDNTIFRKDLILVLTLPQAEVPGTPIQLYYYNSKTKKFVLQSLPQSVSKDGYTVIFKIRHFSSYVALKSVSAISMPIGSGVKIPLPDLLTGAFSHAIALTVPPGRKGIQPSLSLNYRSSNPNSWTGLGWSLNPGYIVRSTRLGPPIYNDQQDTFYFITDSGTTELVYLTDNVYQAKVESSFTKFFKETDGSWTVLGKDGSRLYFGQTTESKEGSDSSRAFSWYLTKALDTNGNYILYSYIKDTGKCYLYHIDYTGSTQGLSPANSVEFTLESRSDIISSYISTSRIATAKRLKEIQVKSGSDLVWRYELEYNYSPDTNRSILKLIKQYGSDDKSMPVIQLGYQNSR